jgi:KamA family protein
VNAIATKTLRLYDARFIDQLPQLRLFSAEDRFAMKVVAQVLPFRCNNYVVEELIDWSRAGDDPLFRLTFPQRGMLAPAQFDRMADLMRAGAGREELNRAANEVRATLNPHPAGQRQLNVPSMDGEVVPGIQHKYRETMLVFPAAGQTCHAYCTFCFRWPQFVNMEDDVRFAAQQAGTFWSYLEHQKGVTDVLVTGGDPLIASTRVLARYLEPLLEPRFEHVSTIRIGSKSLSYWPYRFLTDGDADDLLRLFERVVASGKHLAFMAHFDHPQELGTPAVRQAIRRIRATGAEIRTQAPLLRGINDDPATWSQLWKTQVQLGCIPYYMFVERDTGAKRHFDVPLVRAWEIYREAQQTLSGVARSARGPTMSALPGKVIVDGVAEIRGEKVFVLSFLQARNPDWVKRPFFAAFDPDATWLHDLRPAFGESRFFFEDEMDAMQAPQLQTRRLVKLGSLATAWAPEREEETDVQAVA